jgi:uncharacterized membrane protein
MDKSMSNTEEQAPENYQQPVVEHFYLILVVILLVFGMGYLTVGKTLHYEGADLRIYMAGRATGGMLFTLFLGSVTGGLVWAGKRIIGRNKSANWQKPILWGTAFWAVMTLIFRLILLLDSGG